MAESEKIILIPPDPNHDHLHFDDDEEESRMEIEEGSEGPEKYL